MNLNQISYFNFPTSIIFGAGAVKQLGGYLKSQNIVRPLIVTDPVLAKLDLLQEIIKDLSDQNIPSVLFSQISKNPVRTDVHAGAKVFEEFSCDAVIGIGGGASMDVARAITLMAYHPGDLFDYEEGVGDHLIQGPVPLFVTIPTTSGTGSEVGRSAIISHETTHEKKILFSPKLLAQKVFADPKITMELPGPVTAATGMDALTHNLEAYLAKTYHPMCEGIAIEGIRLAFNSLAKAVHRPNLEARTDMMMSSLMGAVAFQKGLGVVHSLAHPLSTLLDVHHGLANAIMLPFGMKFNQEVCKDKFSFLERALQVGNLIEHLHYLKHEIGIPKTLSDIGVKSGHLSQLAQLAFKDFCHPNNPRTVNEKEFYTLYEEAL